MVQGTGENCLNVTMDMPYVNVKGNHEGPLMGHVGKSTCCNYSQSE